MKGPLSRRSGCRNAESKAFRSSGKRSLIGNDALRYRRMVSASSSARWRGLGSVMGICLDHELPEHQEESEQLGGLTDECGCSLIDGLWLVLPEPWLVA